MNHGSELYSPMIKIICFLYKARGHTTNNCKNRDDKPEKKTLFSPNKLNISDDIAVYHTELFQNIHSPTRLKFDIPLDQTKMDWSEDSEETKFLILTQNHLDEALSYAFNGIETKLMSYSPSSKPPDSLKALLSFTIVTKNEKKH